MAKTKKAEKKTGKAEPASAADIKKLEEAAKKESKPEPPLEIPALKRSIKEILADHVVIAPGSIGMTLADNTPIEEHMAILDYTTSLSDHVGFMIGDVLNNGAVRWGAKYKEALDRTHRAYSTLAGYVEAARRIPIEKRVAALSFSHHREILRLPDEKMETVLKDLEKEMTKKDGHIPTTKELRVKIQHSMPRKKKTPKRVTSGKHGKHGKKGKKVVELPPYDPTQAEQELMDEAEMAIEETAKLLKPDGKLQKVLIQMDTKTKQRWLGKLDDIVLFFKAVQLKTGY